MHVLKDSEAESNLGRCATKMKSNLSKFHLPSKSLLTFCNLYICKASPVLEVTYLVNKLSFTFCK